MKYIFKEYKSNYSDYKYPYTIYASAQEGESLDEIYNEGFLATRIEKNYFYLTRNLRVKLIDFSLTSENRRVLRKAQDLTMENSELKDLSFNYEITKLGTDYFKAKFQKNIIATQKLKWLLSGEFFTNLLTYKVKDEIIGYCITMETKELLHYAYPFYKPELINQNIGMAMMIKAIEHAKKQKKKYVYLGAVYTKYSLYKLQFKGIEWFDGENWNEDIDKLKEKIRENG